VSKKSTRVILSTDVELSSELLNILKSQLTKAIESLRRDGSELSVQLVDDATITTLHRQYMDEDGPTDVLSFEQDLPAEDQAGLLGDIVISVETAQRQADAKPWPLEHELLYLALHGLLHLLGYDHAEPDEAREMFGKQDALLEQLLNA